MTMEVLMKKNNILARFIVLVFGFLFLSQSYAGGDPVGMLQSVANSMIAGLKQNQATLKTKPSIVYQLAYRYVVPHADLDQMAMRVLPPQTWRSATAAQRAQFKKQFTLTLIRTYASALTNYNNQTVKFYPPRGTSGNTVEVGSDIVGGSQSIHVTYRLVRSGGGWRLLDMNVEGVSMLDSFRSQFSDILSQGNMQMLLDRLSRHNNR